MSETLAHQLAAFALETSFDRLPDAVVAEAKRRLIDAFGCAAGALHEPAPTIARRAASRVEGEPGAAVFGGGRSSPDWAAFANGVHIRYLDCNDTYLSLEPAHPSDNWAAVMAAGEAVGASGADWIAAAVVAYEVQCRLCDAAGIRARGWDHTTYGSLSASLAAAKLMGLTHEQTVHALGIAGTTGTALRLTRAGELSMWKGCAFAHAARNGVFAAILAGDGMTGPAPLFEGDMGFQQQVSGPFTLDRLGGPLAGDWMLPKTSIKFVPAEYHSQSAVAAAFELRPKVGDPSRVRSIEIATFRTAVEIIGQDPEKWEPKTRETADHSLPYCTAAALHDGDVYLETFDDEHFTDPKLVAFTGKVKIRHDATLDSRYPHGIPNRITVTLTDGRTLVREVEFPRGHAGNPMTDAEVEAKFRRVAEPRYGKAKADEVLARCWDLEKLTSVTELIALFG